MSGWSSTYRAGTIEIASGATEVVGTGTGWGILADQANLLILPSLGQSTLVDDVTDDTHLEIPEWGAVAVPAGTPYVLVQFPLEISAGTTGGSAGAYTLTVTGEQTAYAHGQTVVFKASFSSTSNATLNITNANGTVLGTKAIQEDGDEVLAPGAIQSGGHYVCRYDAAANSGAGAWILLNPNRSAISGEFRVLPNYAHNPNNAVVINYGTGPSNTGTGISWNYQAGSSASPLATTANSELGFIQAIGWDGTSFSNSGIPNAIVSVATQNWTVSHRGSGWMFQSTPNDTTAGQNELLVCNGVVVMAAGDVASVAAADAKGIGTINGKNGVFDNGSRVFVGPAGATANAVVRFNGTTGRLGKSSGVVIDDSNNVTGVGAFMASGVLSTNNATEAGSATGSIVASGGIYAAKAIRSASSTAATSTTTGSGIFAGGIGVAGKGYFGGALNVTDATASSSPTTGSGIFAGGIGVAGKVLIGGVGGYGWEHTDGTRRLVSYVSASSGGWLGTRSNHPLSFFVNDGGAAVEITTASAVRFPSISTSASGANTFLDSGANNNLLRSTSSARYKRDTEDLDPAVGERLLQKARPVWYRSAIETDRQDWSHYGLIAEEVAEIDPRFVHYGYRNEDWEIVEGERRLKAGAQKVPDGVAYDRLTVPLLALVQQMSLRIADLESRLTKPKPKPKPRRKPSRRRTK